jgi:hypothetical protein
LPRSAIASQCWKNASQRQGHEVQRAKRESQDFPDPKACAALKEKKAIQGRRACEASKGREDYPDPRACRALKEKKATQGRRACAANKGREDYPDRKGLQGQRVILPIRLASISLSSAFLNWKEDSPYRRKESRSRFRMQMR